MHWYLIDVLEILIVFGPVLFIGPAVIMSASQAKPELGIRRRPVRDLSPAEQQLFSNYKSGLEALGLEAKAAFSADGLPGKNVNCVYFGRDTWAIATAIRNKETETKAASAVLYLELTTLFDDGSMLITRNAQISDVLEHPPKAEIHDHRAVKNAEELFRLHRTHVEARNQPVRKIDLADFFSTYEAYYHEYLQHQVGIGLLTFDEAAKSYKGTPRLAWRGILNYLNPFADNFTIPRFVLGMVGGLVFPYLALRTLPAMFAIDFSGTTMLVLLACILTVANLIVGAAWQAKVLIWGFAMSALASRVALPPVIYEEADPWVLLALFWLAAWPGAKLADRLAGRL